MSTCSSNLNHLRDTQTQTEGDIYTGFDKTNTYSVTPSSFLEPGEIPLYWHISNYDKKSAQYSPPSLHLKDLKNLCHKVFEEEYNSDDDLESCISIDNSLFQSVNHLTGQECCVSTAYGQSKEASKLCIQTYTKISSWSSQYKQKITSIDRCQIGKSEFFNNSPMIHQNTCRACCAKIPTSSEQWESDSSFKLPRLLTLPNSGAGDVNNEGFDNKEKRNCNLDEPKNLSNQLQEHEQTNNIHTNSTIHLPSDYQHRKDTVSRKTTSSIDRQRSPRLSFNKSVSLIICIAMKELGRKILSALICQNSQSRGTHLGSLVSN